MNSSKPVTGFIESTLDGAGMAVHSFSGALKASPAKLWTHSTSPTSLFRGAQDFLRAAEKLTPGDTPNAFGFNCAQCLELTLKSYLLHRGNGDEALKLTEQVLINRYGHNVSKAWRKCAQLGLAVAKKVPPW